MTPWEFAEGWYKVDEIEAGIKRSLLTHGRESGDMPRVPADVQSREFAEWLTHQYRLAMAKGIEMGRRCATYGKDGS